MKRRNSGERDEVQSLTIQHGHKKKPHGTPAKVAHRRAPSEGNQESSASMRTCIGCRASAPRSALVRMVRGADGEIVFDLAGGASGRGAWTHPTEDCLRRAARSFRSKASEAVSGDSLPGLLSALEFAATRRARGLVSAARRAGHIALGGDAAAEAFASARAKLVILATDARAASRESWLESAISAGKVYVWSTKAELGALVGRDALAVLAVTDEGLARAIKQVLVLTIPVTSRLAGAILAGARSAVVTKPTDSHGLEDSEDG